MDDIPPTTSPFPGDGDQNMEQIDKISQPDNLVPKSFDDMLDKFNDDDDDDVMIRASSPGIDFAEGKDMTGQTVRQNGPKEPQDKKQEGGDDSAAQSKKIASA